MTTSLLASFLKVFATLLVVIVCRKIDLFEKEPWKALGLSVAAGVPTYFASLAVTQWLFHAFSVTPEIYSLGRVVSLLVASAIVQVIALSICMSLFVRFMRTEVDSLPDFILYSVAISCGYAIGSLSLQYALEAGDPAWSQGVLNALYDGPALMDINIPFISAGIGIILFLISNRNVIHLRYGTTAMVAVIASLVVFLQAAFIVGGLLATLGSPDSINAARTLGESLIEFSSVLSTIFILLAVTLGALLDLNIVTSFIDKIFEGIADEGPTNTLTQEQKRFREILVNPISYSAFLRLFIKSPGQDQQNSPPSLDELRVARTIAGLALSSWRRPETASHCVTEGRALISQQVV